MGSLPSTSDQILNSLKEKFQKEESELDQRYAALSEELRNRIDHFRTNPDFRWQHESAEMMVAEDAQKIADAAQVILDDFQAKGLDEKTSDRITLVDQALGLVVGIESEREKLNLRVKSLGLGSAINLARTMLIEPDTIQALAGVFQFTEDGSDGYPSLN